MEIQPDFKELFTLLNKHKVEFLIVGAYALAFHGFPRFTGDVDIFVRPTPVNAKCILDALTDFGFGSLGISLEDFEEPDNVVQLGVQPVRVDLITSISGVSWEEANKDKVAGRYGNVPVDYIGIEQFKKNKRAVGRQKDLADLDALGE